MNPSKNAMWIGVVVLLLSSQGVSRAIGAEVKIPADPDNAAMLYYQASLIRGPAIRQAVADYVSGKAEATSDVRAEALSNDDLKKYILTATTLKKCDWGLLYSQGTNTLLPYLREMRDLARVLLADAKMSAEQGNAERAVDRCLAAYRLAEHDNDGMCLVTYVSAKSLDMMTHDVLRGILAKVKKTPALLDRLQQGLNEVCGETVSLQTVAQSDPILAVSTLAGNAEEAKSWISEHVLPQGDSARKARILNEIGTERAKAFAMECRSFASRRMARHVSVLASNQTFLKKYAAIAELDAEKVRDDLSDAEYLAWRVLPAISRAFEAAVRDQAGFSALQAAIAVYRAQLKTGQLPDVLPNDAPIDPISHQTFLYEKKGDHFTLRSREKCPGKNETMTFEF